MREPDCTSPHPILAGMGLIVGMGVALPRVARTGEAAHVVIADVTAAAIVHTALILI